MGTIVEELKKKTGASGNNISEVISNMEMPGGGDLQVPFVVKIKEVENPQSETRTFELDGCDYSDILNVVKTYVGDPSSKPVMLCCELGTYINYFPAYYTGMPTYATGIEFRKEVVEYNGITNKLEYVRRMVKISPDGTAVTDQETLFSWDGVAN